jgi:hypothetical protein
MDNAIKAINGCLVLLDAVQRQGLLAKKRQRLAAVPRLQCRTLLDFWFSHTTPNRRLRPI